MSNTCKNICLKLKAKVRPRQHGLGGPYQQGFKRCFICDIFMNWNGLFCPCCGGRLAIRPAASKFKNLPEHVYIE